MLLIILIMHLTLKLKFSWNCHE